MKDTTVLELFEYNCDGTSKKHLRYVRVPNNFLKHKQEKRYFGDGYRTITTFTEEGWEWLAGFERMASKGNRNWLYMEELSDKEVAKKAQQLTKEIKWLCEELAVLTD